MNEREQEIFRAEREKRLGVSRKDEEVLERELKQIREWDERRIMLTENLIKDYNLEALLLSRISYLLFWIGRLQRMVKNRDHKLQKHEGKHRASRQHYTQMEGE